MLTTPCCVRRASIACRVDGLKTIPASEVPDYGVACVVLSNTCGIGVPLWLTPSEEAEIFDAPMETSLPKPAQSMASALEVSNPANRVSHVLSPETAPAHFAGNTAFFAPTAGACVAAPTANAAPPSNAALAVDGGDAEQQDMSC